MAMSEDVLKDIEEYNAGKIDFREFRRRQYVRSQKTFAPKLLDHFQKKEWKEFIDMALGVYEVMPIAFDLYDDVPDSMKYEFCTQAYTHHGDSVPSVRKAVRQALKYGRPDLPEELKTAEEITVYRAGEEPINKAKYRISWTTNINVAEFFLNKYIRRHATHLYKAKIKPEHIIAYTNDREEEEILQYRHVYDIEDITGILTDGKKQE